MNFVKSKHLLIFFLRFNYLLPKAPQDIPISPVWYFNQRLLNVYDQCFPSDADFIFFARFAYEQHHFRSPINFAMHKIKPVTPTAGIVKDNFKRVIERFIARDNAFSFEFNQRNTSTFDSF